MEKVLFYYIVSFNFQNELKPLQDAEEATTVIDKEHPGLKVNITYLTNTHPCFLALTFNY